MNRRLFAKRTISSGLGIAIASATPGPTVGHAIHQPVSETGRSLVLSPTDLSDLVANDPEDVHLIDCREIRDYRNRHVPNAVHGWWQDTIDPEYPVYGAVTTQGFEQSKRIDILRRLGVSLDKRVVVYDDMSSFRASRIVWFLRFLGYPRVSALDGGFQAWLDIGGPVESGEDTVDSMADVFVEPQEGYYLVTSQLADRIGDERIAILDTRLEGERLEEGDNSVEPSTIPGSYWFPWTSFVDPVSGRIIDRSGVSNLIDDVVRDEIDEIVVFGTFGVDASLPWLAIAAAGYASVITYDRGWIEWASRTDLPTQPI